MRKMFCTILCVILSLGLCFGFSGCGGGTGGGGTGGGGDDDKLKPIPEPTRDEANVIFDDFDNIDYNTWGIMHSRWGQDNHGGVIRENVGYTADGKLVITANGNFYNGDKKDVKGNIAKKTGGAITSHKTTGPGEYTVRMKALPRFGATTAFWTFFNDGKTLNDYGRVYNSEIDFELNTVSFDSTMCTNWTSEKDFDNVIVKTKFFHNDGAWHDYTFRWMTAPERIEYYLDKELINVSLSHVPVYAANATIGAWFAGFAGTADFETDYMLVDSYKFTPYLGQPYEMTKDTMPPTTDAGYPKTPMTLPNVNMIADSSFEHPYMTNNTQNAWSLSGDDVNNISTSIIDGVGRNNSRGLRLKPDDKVVQVFSQTYPNYKMDVSAYFKHSATQSGKFVVQYQDKLGIALGGDEIIINSSTPGFVANEFYKVSKSIVVPKSINGKDVGITRIRFVADDIVGNEIIVDDVEAYHII